MSARIVFLLDVDNTLLDNDLVKQHLEMVLKRDAGLAIEQRFWKLYEDVRARSWARSASRSPLSAFAKRAAMPSRSIASLRTCTRCPSPNPSIPALELLRWLREIGVPVILSDGDPWFQAKKITDAGLGEAVGGNVLIFLHKEKHVDDIKRWSRPTAISQSTTRRTY